MLAKSEDAGATTSIEHGESRVISTDLPSGNVSIYEHYLGATYRLDAERSLGKILLKDVFHIINEEDPSQVENPVSKVLKRGIIIGLAMHTISSGEKTSGGGVSSLTTVVQPIKDENGNVTGVVLCLPRLLVNTKK